MYLPGLIIFMLINSSNLMRLVIYGNQKMEQLEGWAHDYFSLVNNYDYSPPAYKEVPFSQENFCDFWKIVPIKDRDTLEFFWLLDNYEPFYKSDPSKYVSHLFGHEGKNSLLSTLIDEGLALELSSGPSNEMKLFTKFSVSISLTKEGVKRYKDVVAYVFKYLQILKKRGPSKDVFEEINKIGEIRFAHKDKERPINLVSSVSSAMHRYPIEDILRYPYLFEEFKPDEIQKTLDSFTLNNLRIVLTSKEVEAECKESEKWYQTKHCKSPMPEEFKELFHNSTIEPKKTKKILDLPPKNLFIPKNFNVSAKDQKSMEKTPKKVYSSEFCDLYFKQDDTFKTPKGDLQMKLYSNEYNQTS